jgi:cytoskeletal protein CcmA (bactofilin family)
MKNSASVKKRTEHASVSILTSDCHFEGRMICKGISRIGGVVQGEIHSEGVLIIEKGANVEAIVHADEVVVQGNIKGKIEISQRIEFTATGAFSGELKTPILFVTDGARLNGQLTMLSQSELKRDAKEIEKLDMDPSVAKDPEIQYEK